MPKQAQAKKPGIAQKAFWALINALEKQISIDKFDVSNLSPYEVILKDGIMEVRH